MKYKLLHKFTYESHHHRRDSNSLDSLLDRVDRLEHVYGNLEHVYGDLEYLKLIDTDTDEILYELEKDYS